MLWPDGSLTAGPLDPSRELLPLLRRIRETRAQATDAESRMNTLVERGDALRKDLAAAEGAVDSLTERCYQADLELSSLEKDLTHTGRSTCMLESASTTGWNSATTMPDASAISTLPSAVS